MTNPSPTPSDSSLPAFAAEADSPAASPLPPSRPTTSTSSAAANANAKEPVGMAAVKEKLTKRIPRQTGTLRIQLAGARNLKVRLWF